MQTTLQKLHKTAKTLSNHIARGNRLNNRRSFVLVDRFNDLKDKARDEDVWEVFCSETGSCPTHDAYDYFA